MTPTEFVISTETIIGGVEVIGGGTNAIDPSMGGIGRLANQQQIPKYDGIEF